MISAVQTKTNSVDISLQEFSREVQVFIEEAQKAFEIAEAEIKLGNSIRGSVLKKVSERNNNLRLIALWHYQKGVEKIQQAIKNLEQAIYFDPIPKCREFINSKINEYLKNVQKVLTYQQKIEVAVHV